MDNKIRSLKISFIFETILGVLVALFIAMFVGIMATDSPSSPSNDMIMGGMFAFLIVFAPFVLFSYLSIRELNKYEENNKLLFNIINSLLVFSIFLPLGIWQLYLIFKLNNTKQDVAVINENENSRKSYVKLICLIIILLIISLYIISPYLDKESKVIVDCGKEKIFTKVRSSKTLYFADKSSLRLHRTNYSTLGFLKRNIIVITNPYIIEDATACIERSSSQYLIKTEIKK